MGDRWYGQAGGNTMPTREGQEQAVWAEIRKLWMKLREPTPIDTTPKEVLWSYSGTVNPLTDRDGQRWPAIYNLRLASVTLTLASPSSLPVNVEVYTSGGYTANLVLSPGVTFQVYGVNQFFGAGSQLWPRLKALPQGDGEMLGIIFRYLMSQS